MVQTEEYKRISRCLNHKLTNEAMDRSFMECYELYGKNRMANCLYCDQDHPNLEQCHYYEKVFVIHEKKEGENFTTPYNP